MATIWDISSFHDLTNINSGYQFADGDIIQAEHINNALENTGWLKEKVDDLITRVVILEETAILYNHCIKIFNTEVNGGTTIVKCAVLLLQDNYSTRYTATTLANEIRRIMDGIIDCAYIETENTSSSSTSRYYSGVIFTTGSSRLYVYVDGVQKITNLSSSYSVSDTITQVKKNS